METEREVSSVRTFPRASLPPVRPWQPRTPRRQAVARITGGKESLRVMVELQGVDAGPMASLRFFANHEGDLTLFPRRCRRLPMMLHRHPGATHAATRQRRTSCNEAISAPRGVKRGGKKAEIEDGSGVHHEAGGDRSLGGRRSSSGAPCCWNVSMMVGGRKESFEAGHVRVERIGPRHFMVQSLGKSGSSIEARRIVSFPFIWKTKIG